MHEDHLPGVNLRDDGLHGTAIIQPLHIQEQDPAGELDFNLTGNKLGGNLFDYFLGKGQ